MHFYHIKDVISKGGVHRSIWREVPEILYKYLFDIVDSDEGTKDRVPNGLRGLQRRQRPCY